MSHPRLLIAILWVVCGSTAGATEQTGSISGVVRDVTGGPLAGVTVEARGGSSTRLTTVTDAAGQYRIERLTAGTYQLVFTLVNFASIVRNGVVVRGSAADGVAHVDVVMGLGLS